MPSFKKDYELFRSSNLQKIKHGDLIDLANLNYPSPSAQLRAKYILSKYYPNIISSRNEVRLFHPSFFGIGHFSEIIMISLAERLGILSLCKEFKIPRLKHSTIPISLLKMLEKYSTQKIRLLPWVCLQDYKMSEIDFLRFTHREHYTDNILDPINTSNYPPVGKLIFAVNARAQESDWNQIYNSAAESSVLTQYDIDKSTQLLNRPYLSIDSSRCPDKYILLHLRTPRDYVCYRDTVHKNYNELIDVMYKTTGLPIIRIGLGPSLTPKNYLYDFNNMFFQDNLIELVFNCEYYIGNSSGPSMLPGLLRRKTLIIDCATPLTALTHANYSYTMIHMREHEPISSTSDQLITAFKLFYKSVNACKSSYSLNGYESVSAKNYFLFKYSL